MVEMFKKRPNVKNLSVIRSSERKKVIQHITRLYGLEDIDQDTKNSILPEGAQVPSLHLILLLCYIACC